MAMDPKQERVLRDGTATEADQPRRTDRAAVRAQAENPPVEQRPRPRPRTAAVADIRVNQPSGTPGEQLAREGGAERVPELGRSRNEESNVEAPPRSTAPEPAKETNGDAPMVDRGEARRVLKARREHSKGDGNFPKVAPGPELADEREEDRTPRDLPKSRDDSSAAKGNTPAGLVDRNPKLEARDDHQPNRPRRARPAPAAVRSRTAKKTNRTKTNTRSGQATRGTRKTTKATKNPQRRSAAARGSRKPLTKRAVRRGGPRGGGGATRGGKR